MKKFKKENFNTGLAVLAICEEFKKDGVSPKEAYKEIKWAFKTLEAAPHVFNEVHSITLPEHNIAFDMKTTSVKKLIKKLRKLHYTYYKIVMDDGSYYEEYPNGSRSSNKGNIPISVLNLLHLFTPD